VVHLDTSKHRYGLTFPAEMPDHQIELCCARFWQDDLYKSGNLDSPDTHMLRAIRMLLSPHEYQIHGWTEKIVWAFCNHNEVIIMGPAASSKSHTCGLLSVCDWMVAPGVTSTFFASTTKSALERRSWNSILHFHQLFKNRGAPGILSKTRTAIINEDDAKNEDGTRKGFDVKSGIFGIAVLAGTLEDAKSNIIGVHQPTWDGGVRLFADEAQAVKQAFIEARTNLLIGTPDVRTILLGNPMRFEDPLGTLAEPREGWSSVTIEDEVWDTRGGGVCIHLDGEKSPAVVEKGGAKKYPFLINRKTMSRVLAANVGNEESRDYLTMCRGWIANESDFDVVLPGSYVYKFRMQRKVVWRGEPLKLAGIDPAFSSGGDSAVLQTASLGYDEDGIRVLAFDSPTPLVISDKDNLPVEYQLAEQVRRFAGLYGFKASDTGVDESGIQRLSDVLEMEWERGIWRCSFAKKASDLPVSVHNPTPCREYYKNVVTELWYSMQQFGQFEQIAQLPQQAAKEFGMRRVLPRRPRQLESKKDMRKRLGHSPDTADACALVLGVARHVHGFTPGATMYGPSGRGYMGVGQFSSWRERMDGIESYSEDMVEAASF